MHPVESQIACPSCHTRSANVFLSPTANISLLELLSHQASLYGAISTPRIYSDPLREALVRTTSVEGSSGKGLLRDAQNTSQAIARE